jgi:S1-C subfamily serine protease
VRESRCVSPGGGENFLYVFKPSPAGDGPDCVRTACAAATLPLRSRAAARLWAAGHAPARERCRRGRTILAGRDRLSSPARRQPRCAPDPARWSSRAGRASASCGSGRRDRGSGLTPSSLAKSWPGRENGPGRSDGLAGERGGASSYCIRRIPTTSRWCKSTCMIVDTSAKELLFSTVRIVKKNSQGTSVGTGFLLSSPVSAGNSRIFLVTNKHVVEDAESLHLGFIARNDPENSPNLGQRIDVDITTPHLVWIGHPDPKVDVALIQVSGIISQLHGRIYYRSVPSSQMPVDGDGVFIDAVEEVVFIGYPDGRQDPKHLTPIIRRGTTATPIELDFGGAPTFLIDGSVFGGSSGSPVFLMNNGFYRAGPLEVRPGNRLVLVGVVAATFIRQNLWPVIAGTGPHVRIAQELNLGVVYNAEAIRQTIAEYERNVPTALPTVETVTLEGAEES